MPLDEASRSRYARHLSLPEVGEAGQEKLLASRVLVVGAGGLGSPALLYLAAAGVGTLGVADGDAVDASNLQRQVLYATADAGRPKTEAAAARLSALNPAIRVETHGLLTEGNALDLVARYDVVVDGADNFEARYLVNDACVLAAKPNVHASVHRFEGRASVFAARLGPCYRCLHPDPPEEGLVPSCAEAGVLGVLPGILGTIQAAETLKLLLGLGEPLVGRLLLVDVLAASMRTIRFEKDPGCAICGSRPTIRRVASVAAACGVPARATGAAVEEIDPEELAARLASSRPPLLLDVREPHEVAAGAIDGSVRIPLGEIGARLAELPAGRPVVVHCATSARSARAARLLLESGRRDVSILAGGFVAWRGRRSAVSAT